MTIDTRYSNHPDDVKHYTTEQLRQHFLIESIFSIDSISLTHSHSDRIIIGGIMPVNKRLSLNASKEMGVDFFCQRREIGIINIGNKGYITIDNERIALEQYDGFYIARGTKNIHLESESSKKPAKFYLNSAPAHYSYPSIKIQHSKANPLKLGDDNNCNKRTIYQYVHPAICESCQLLMGLTMLEPGNLWNTMPCHTHQRRMEAYFYFAMDSGSQVIHLMGQPQQTRHIMVTNEQAVISPSWSIHSGVGTSNYAFIWGMLGENQAFEDMDTIPTSFLK
ncbi:5-dehydro-4-deoxy-D-glucuronate isomerase [Agarilytica rhodophyticola]|uniref:5-dehydro-4-deoxy-D-glucuronate isomerase n=1 Tax=Agarilytica rhodophyticola TaxID=1737490 RepID=UPI000B341F26|nr:5-dehydro-4-deoxy-D-glucuronate isomerase [Agarilytica rhodophyticola]